MKESSKGSSILHIIVNCTKGTKGSGAFNGYYRDVLFGPVSLLSFPNASMIWP